MPRTITLMPLHWSVPDKRFMILPSTAFLFLTRSPREARPSPGLPSPLRPRPGLYGPAPFGSDRTCRNCSSTVRSRSSHRDPLGGLASSDRRSLSRCMSAPDLHERHLLSYVFSARHEKD